METKDGDHSLFLNFSLTLHHCVVFCLLDIPKVDVMAHAYNTSFFRAVAGGL